LVPTSAFSPSCGPKRGLAALLAELLSEKLALPGGNLEFATEA
jgi:hypothetical protein